MGAEGDEQPKLYFDMLPKVYAGIQEQIRQADTKSAFVAAFNGVLVGFVANDLALIKDLYKASHNWGACLGLLAASLLLASPVAVSIHYLISAVRPRLGADAKKSRIFFGHIAQNYGRDGLKYRDDAIQMGRSEWAEDYAFQIVEVAAIAWAKHTNVRAAMTWSFWAFGLLVVLSLVVHIIVAIASPS
jgi:hypothetical protein